MERPPRPIYVAPDLSEEQKEFRREVGRLRDEVCYAQSLLAEHIRKCEHIFVPAGKGFNAEWNKYTNEWLADCGAKCFICNKQAEWYCLQSPTNVCLYNDDDWNMDSCIYCGQPDERK